MKKLELFCQRFGIALIPICLILIQCSLWPEMELLAPSLPDMKHSFGIQDAQIQQLLTFNFVGFLLGVLFAGSLCDSLGRRKVMVWGLFAYIISSFGCALGTSFNLLMIARFLQGFFMTGPVIALSVILLEITAGAKQIFWLSLANSIITFCMAAAPIIGSFINDYFGYRGNLWSIFILSLLGAVPAFFLIPESLLKEKQTAFNLKVLASNYLTLLKDWRFMCLSIPICSLAAAYWIYVGISALYMVDYLGISASYFGRYQGPIVACFSVVSLGSGKILSRFGLVNLVRGSSVFMILGCGVLFILSMLKLERAAITTVLMMFFVGGMAPICAVLFPISMNHLPAELQGSAQAMIQAIRLFFASIGTFVLGFLYSGPFLPVASIFLLILIVSLVFLKAGKNFLQEDQNETKRPMLGH